MAPTESGHELIIPSSSSEEEEHCVHAMQLVSAAVFPMVMQAAIDLELLEIIARAGSGAHLSPEEIASQLPTQNPEAPQMVDRILRLLVSHSVLTCSIDHDHDHALKPSHDGDDATVVKRLYGLTPTSNYYLRNQEGISLTPLMHLFHDKAFMDSWYVLKDAVLEGGIPFDKVHGANAFEYLGKNPRLNLLFNRGMSSYTTIVMKNILEKYSGFEDIKELVDVGGGLGLGLKMITSKHPTIKAINFDLPHVIQHAPPYPGVEHISGDMFVGIPKGDAILMKGIIHDWSDDESLKILKNCYAALPDDGKVIVIELIVPEAPEKNAASRLVFQSDLIMMAQNPGGKERTKLQFQSLATRAGFGGIKFQFCISSYWVMEFYK